MDKIANKKEALEIMESGGIVKFKGHCNMFYFKIVNNSIVTIVDDLENACEIDGIPLFNSIDFFELHESKEPSDLSEKYKKAIAALKYYASSDNWHIETSGDTYARIDNEDVGVGEFIICESMGTDDSSVGGLLARQTLKEINEGF